MKKFIALTVTLCLVLCSFSGCSHILDLSAVDRVEATPHFAFSRDTLFDDSKEIFMDAAELTADAVEYDRYRSSLHYNTLSSNEKSIYHALEYAMEQGYTNILVDRLLAEDVKTLEKVAQLLSLDSPLLEQNLHYDLGNFTTPHPVDAGLISLNATLEGYYITVDNFEASLWDKKLEAIKKAEAVIAKMPQGLAPEAAAEWIYRYVADTVTYQDYEGEDVEKYLYDALVVGTTHCDGYANALALLFTLAGLENSEKMYTAPNTEENEAEAVGHTWNFIKLGDCWHNIDGTGENMIPVKGTQMAGGYYFCFGDELLEFATAYGENYPVGESLYLPVDGRVDSLTSGFVSAVKRGYAAHGNKWALIIVKSYDEAAVGSAMQRVADSLCRTICWINIPQPDGSTSVLVYDERIMQK